MALVEKRLVLKVSGEQLGSVDKTFDLDNGYRVARIIKALNDADYQIACVMGAGNVVRGQEMAEDGYPNKITADHMGMLGTLQNGIFLNELISGLDIESRLMSNVPVEGVSEPFKYRKACNFLRDGKVLLLGGGTGRPGRTTDTATVSLAHEIHAGAGAIKTTSVDGVYDKDPIKYPAEAVRIPEMTIQQALENPEVRVMDRGALGLAQDHGITIRICQPEIDAVMGVLSGNTSSGSIISPS
ncbi:MAG: uridylate kinase [Patescibacteria group bacterium]